MMYKIRSDEFFDYYEAGIICNENEVIYRFLIECPDGTRIAYDKCGVRADEHQIPDYNPAYAFRFIPGFHVPDWAKGAVQYQIFPDRFCNGDPSNDVVDNEYYYTVGHSKHIDNWDALPTDTDIRCFYGGDLQGILNKLDYLQDLGIEVLYLNPIFVSPSSHKYDCQDYEHIDPHFGVITDDTDHVMQSWEKHNGYAPKYIRRVTSEENLEKSDALLPGSARSCTAGVCALFWTAYSITVAPSTNGWTMKASIWERPVSSRVHSRAFTVPTGLISTSMIPAMAGAPCTRAGGAIPPFPS